MTMERIVRCDMCGCRLYVYHEVFKQGDRFRLDEPFPDESPRTLPAFVLCHECAGAYCDSHKGFHRVGSPRPIGDIWKAAG
jgi:uncharacterized Zn finger protein